VSRAGVAGACAVLLIVFGLVCCAKSENPPQPVAVAVPQPVVPVAPVQATTPAIVAPAPVIVQQAPSHSDGLVEGMVLGHLMSGGGGYGRTTVIHNHTTTVVRPTYRPTYRGRRR
jgi:hypothetical protein